MHTHNTYIYIYKRKIRMRVAANLSRFLCPSFHHEAPARVGPGWKGPRTRQLIRRRRFAGRLLHILVPIPGAHHLLYTRDNSERCRRGTCSHVHPQGLSYIHCGSAESAIFYTYTFSREHLLTYTIITICMIILPIIKKFYLHFDGRVSSYSL